ncbi:hypothetical protein AVEN_93783-1 [Araneus ventricosus]|uniref:Uncharacterized protein n=1 Tax=Araneus ventricosus TaxID=182803 RepID=A0A4Y2L6Q3_ARAVE|nr:hypothetical protein AVEN_93783-1 [Araneus ventricosus]
MATSDRAKVPQFSHHRSYTEQYSAVLDELRKKISADDESDALYLDGEATEYSYKETDSEADVKDNQLNYKLKTEKR